MVKLFDTKKFVNSLKIHQMQDDAGDLYIPVSYINKAMSIASSFSDDEYQLAIDEIINERRSIEFNNEELKKSYTEAMFECLQYWREAGHFIDLDNGKK